MSMPTLPAGPPIKLEDAASMLMASIAMEELGLSHIISAESEKLQYVLSKGYKESNGREATAEEVLEVNKSIKCMIDSILQLQMLLKAKLECVEEILRENRPPHPKPPHPPIPPIPPYPPIPPEAVSAVSYPGRDSQCWESGKPLLWRHSECQKQYCIPLSPDGGKLILKKGKCYTVSFAVDICSEQRGRVDGKLAIGIRLSEAGRYKDVFIYHAPAARTDSPETISAGGIHISANPAFGLEEDEDRFDGRSAPELSIVLLSPKGVAVRQAGISVTEM